MLKPPARVAPLTPGLRAGELNGVPEPPLAFVPREELAELRAAVLDADSGVVGLTGRALGLSGQGGIGKSVLAAALARDDAVRQHFPDGIYWVTVGEKADLVAAQIDLLERLGAEHGGLRSATQGLSMLREVQADRRCLVIVDDVWSIAAAAAFRATGPRGRILYTSRDAAVLHGVAADIRQVDTLPAATAWELLRRLTGSDELPPEANRICAATGYVALGVALAGAAIGQGGKSWRLIADQLEGGESTFLHHPYANTFKAMQVGVGALDETDRQAYRSLAVYPGDTAIPVRAVSRLWSHLFGTPADQTLARLQTFADRSLLTAEHGNIAFHDLQREFLLLQTGELSLAHADLLAAYHALLPAEDYRWARLPQDEPYIWEHLVYHLRGVGDGTAIKALVCDLGWIAVRCFLSGPYAAEADVRQAADLFPGHSGIGWMLRLLTQWGHLLVGQPTVGDLAVTLASRALDPPSEVRAGTLAALLPRCYLAPAWGLGGIMPALIRVLDGHTDWVAGVAFSPNGRLLASVGDDGVIRLCDPTTGQVITDLESRVGVRQVAFSPDGKLMASASQDGTIWLWNLATSQPVFILEGHTGMVEGVAFSSDNKLLASASTDRTIRLWDPATGQPMTILRGHHSAVSAVAFSPDGQLLASCSDDGMIRLWDPATGQPMTILRAHHGPVSAVTFSPDGQLLASGDNAVRLWDPATGQLISILEGHTEWILGLAFSPDGRLLASASRDGTIRLWDPATGQAAVLEGQPHWVTAVAFSPDGQLLASACGNGTIRLWDPAGGQAAAALEGHSDWVLGVAFSPDGRQLATASGDGTIRLWDPATGQPVSILHGHTSTISAVAFSPNGKLLASASGDRTIRLWDSATGQPVSILHGHTSTISAVAFSPDGKLLASASHDGTARIWDLAIARTIVDFHGHTSWVYAVAFSPDGRQLASASQDGTIRIWNPATSQLVSNLQGHTKAVRALAFSPDGKLLASAGGDGTIRLWDPATGQPVSTLQGHGNMVYAVSFSPQGQRLATASEDGTIRLWNTSNYAAISQLSVGVAVTALAWGPSGIAASAHKGLLKLAVIDGTVDTQP
jgi:WD40 repeat protein